MVKSVKRTLRDAYNKKQKVKIKYYSLSSDEVKWRIVSIYKLENDFMIAFCHLRNGERTFVKDRIRSAIIQEEKYQIPTNWQPQCKVWTN